MGTHPQLRLGRGAVITAQLHGMVGANTAPVVSGRGKVFVCQNLSEFGPFWGDILRNFFHVQSFFTYRTSFILSSPVLTGF